MADIVRKEICKCEKCGNEAEMEITCSLPDESSTASPPDTTHKHQKIKGTATCSTCGNEADMWIDY